MTNQFWSDEALLSSLKQCVVDAGRVILDIYESDDFGVEAKADNSPLTKADKAAHTVIANALKEIKPEIPLVSEEDEQSIAQSSAHETFWLIDPLDGTKEFIKRTGEFTVNIALVHKGAPVLGVVGIPAQDLVYWGGTGLGAYRASTVDMENSGQCLNCQDRSGTIRVVASKSHMNEETQKFIQDLPGECELLQAGSSLKFLKIAENEADVYPRLGPTCEWDTAAAQAVLEGAGGQVTQLCGTPMQYGKDDPLNPYFVAKGTGSYE